jgi:hypothetical protein
MMSVASGIAIALCVGIAAACLGFIFFLRHRPMAANRERQGWRIRRVVSGRWTYEERVDGVWMGVPFGEIVDFREPPYVIVAASADTWRTFPKWARERRMEIIGRVRSELQGRGYVIEGPEEAPANAELPPVHSSGSKLRQA